MLEVKNGYKLKWYYTIICNYRQLPLSESA